MASPVEYHQNLTESLPCPSFNSNVLSMGSKLQAISATSILALPNNLAVLCPANDLPVVNNKLSSSRSCNSNFEDALLQTIKSNRSGGSHFGFNVSNFVVEICSTLSLPVHLSTKYGSVKIKFDVK